MQEILNRLGLSIAYSTIVEQTEKQFRSRVTACATITNTKTGEVVAELSTTATHLIELRVETFLDAFAAGYDFFRRENVKCTP